MQRFKALKNFLSCIEDNDICIFSGNDLNSEAYNLDRVGNFYVVDSDSTALSFGLGVAMNTNKRVFVFCGDGDVLKNYDVIPQIAASKCNNIFVVILDNGCYYSSGKQPTIRDNFKSFKGAIMYLGLLVFNLTPYLSKKKELKNTIEYMVGPIIIFLDIDKKGISNSLINIDITKPNITKRVSIFIKNESIGSSMFISPENMFTNIKGED